MLLYLVERYDEDKHGITTWRVPLGIYKDKGNAAIRVCDDSKRMRVPTKCRIVELETDIEDLK